MSLLATLVETKALLETIAASLATGIGITVAFAVAIFGAARFLEAQRDGRALVATASAALTVIFLGICAAGVAAGIYVLAE